MIGQSSIGMWYMHDQPGWQKSVMRLVDVFVDGLRVQTKVETETRLAPHRGEAKESAKGRPRRHGYRKDRK